MTAQSKRVQTSFELRLEAPATPERVVAAAKFVSGVLKAAHPRMPEGSITLVVTNYSMGAAVRAWTPAAREATQLFLTFLEHPQNVLKNHVVALKMAEEIGKVSDELKGAHVIRTRGHKIVATLDDKFTERMKKLARSTQETALQGTTLIYTHVLRVGRATEQRDVTARLQINGTYYEIPVEKEAQVDFFEAAKAGGVFPVRLETMWRRSATGDLSIDIDNCIAVEVDRQWKETSGEDFIRLAREAAPSGFDEAELDERLALIMAARQ